MWRVPLSLPFPYPKPSPHSMCAVFVLRIVYRLALTDACNPAIVMPLLFFPAIVDLRCYLLLHFLLATSSLYTSTRISCC